MAKLTIRNASTAPFFLPDLRIQLGPGGSAQIERALPELEAMPIFMGLFEAGDLAIDAIEIETWELYWRNFLAGEGGYALADATRIIHKPTVTPGQATSAPGQGPTEVVYGTILGLHFDNPTDQAYRIMKVDSTFVVGGAGPAGNGENASFHVHWTKSSDLDESGATVRWRLSYTVFDGIDDEIAQIAPTGIIEWDDTYDDAGTTTRIVYRTENQPAAGLVPGYYIGLCLEYVPANTTLSGGPVVISTDLLFRNYVNRGT